MEGLRLDQCEGKGQVQLNFEEALGVHLVEKERKRELVKSSGLVWLSASV